MQVRSIDLINSSLFLTSKKPKKDDDKGTLVTTNLSEREIFNYLNFSSNRIVKKNDNLLAVPLEDMKQEIRLSTLAKNAGVNTPDIDKKGNYKVKYDKADVKENPLTKGHIQAALTQIDIMDKLGLIHRDIEFEHVFYSKNSNDVEFDCFRFGYLTNENPCDVEWDFSEVQYPTNLNQFENNCIGQYLSTLETEEERDDFVRGYLPIASKFHGERAYYLETTGKGTQDNIQYEKAQAMLFENPDDTTVELFKKRVQTEYKQRQIFTDWDEGMGACGHKPDEERAVNAVCEHFDSICNGIDYYNRLSDLELQKTDSVHKHYFEYEKEYAKHFVDNRVVQIGGRKNQEYEGMTFWTLNPKNEVNKSHKNVPEEKKAEFNKFMKSYKILPIELKRLPTISLKEQYKELLNFK